MIEVLGDVATLAEVVAETIVAPWVIENEINLTYPATITVSRDKDEDATWPRDRGVLAAGGQGGRRGHLVADHRLDQRRRPDPVGRPGAAGHRAVRR